MCVREGGRGGMTSSVGAKRSGSTVVPNNTEKKVVMDTYTI